MSLNNALKQANRVEYAYAQRADQDNTFKTYVLGADPVNDAGAADLPDALWLSHLEIALKGLAGPPATAVTVRLSWDVNRDEMISTEQVVTLLDGITAGSASCVAQYAEAPAPLKRPPTLGAQGKIHAHLKLNNGTATLTTVRAIYTPATAR